MEKRELSHFDDRTSASWKKIAASHGQNYCLLYLLTILTGIFAQGFVSERLVVSGDAAATATNILAHKSLFEWSFTVYLIEMACQIMKTALLYFLLGPVSWSIAPFPPRKR